MHVVRMKGKTVEDAVKGALEVLKAPREGVDIRVLEQGESGVLGVFGGKDAEVEVKIKAEVSDEAKQILQDILDKMGFTAQAYTNDETEDTVFLEIKSDDVSRIIGKDGKTLDAIQYLVSIMANKGKESRRRVDIDCGGYRRKQEKRIERIAIETIDEAIISGKEIELPPMTAKERRIVHMTVKESNKAESASVGISGSRRVVISPKK